MEDIWLLRENLSDHLGSELCLIFSKASPLVSSFRENYWELKVQETFTNEMKPDRTTWEQFYAELRNNNTLIEFNNIEIDADNLSDQCCLNI